jgi:predicted glycogen debranching enzyme
MSNHLVWPTVRVDGDLERARVEWIHTNGAGAYASSTVARMHTRRYHGLLVAALDPPRRRHVILSHVDSTLRIDGSALQLATHQFPGVPPTGGYRMLTVFTQDPLPRWTYSVNGGELEQTLALARGANTVVLRYLWTGPKPVSLELRPLMALRSFHDLVSEHGAMLQRVEMRQNEVAVRPVPNLPRIVFRHKGIFIGSPDWWRRFEYLAEQSRGLAFQEDLWTPGVLRLELQPGVPTYFTCGVDPLPEEPAEEILAGAREWLKTCDPGPDRPWAVRQLSIAADCFRADLAPMPGVIAGYPWFEIWGRHTLMALPGLYLATGKVEGAKQVLVSLIRHIREGLVPNRLPDDGSAAEYHSVDATLLLFEAARRMALALGPADPFISSTLFPALSGIFEVLSHGTRDGIHVSAEGLLAAGGPGTSLTWMDARVDDRPVTSRAGLAVEVQALWSRGCDTLAWLATELGDGALAARAQSARDRARIAFAQRFWCASINYPYDVVSEESAPPGSWTDASVRPNALMALAFDPELFEPWQREAIITQAERVLLTPTGLRTLSPNDSQYRAVYRGGVAERDSSYHQGTTWTFLLGLYARAVKATYPDDGARLGRLRALLEGVLGNVLALGQAAEIADGDAPHRLNGCPAHAVGVAELLRALVEELKL